MIFHLIKSIGAGMSILHIAEKNSIAKSVADVLSSHKKRTVYSNSLFNPVFEFELENKEHHFSSVRGHIFNQELPKECQYWSSYDNRKILFQDLPMVKKLGDEMEDVVKNLERLAKEHTELILWLDCDREGEAISFEVIDIIKKINPKIKIKRARFSAVTPTDVWNAYNKLVEPNKLEADAVSYRTEIDFRTGCAFTRLQTVIFQSYFRTEENLMLSYGPCQIPTLNFVVQRYLEIKNFKPEKYWSLQMNCIIDENTKIPFHWEKKNTKNEIEAQEAFNRVRSSTNKEVYGIVKERKKVERKKARPYPLTTVKYQKLATDKLKISSAEAMETAEKLYQKGYISYPRTETNTFPKTINLKELIKRLEGSKEFGKYVKNLLDDNQYVHPKTGNQNDEAHTPIHPVQMVNKDSLTQEEWRVYDLITRSFLACCSSDAIGEDFEVKADVLGEGFKASYLTIKKQGYLEIYPFERWVETSFPNVPDKFLANVTLKEDKTSPPSYLTEANLIDLMEKNEIGTDSTIHEHIENIQKRKYVVKSNNTLKPTNLGASLVQTYEELEVVLPKCDIRRKMEEKMKMIARGELDKDIATQESLDEMIPIFDKIKSVKELWVKTLKKYIDSNSDLKKIEISQKTQAEISISDRKASITAGKCLKCSSNTVFRFSEKFKKYFIGCSAFPKCNQIESLPSFIESIKESDHACGKCKGKKLTIKANINKIFDPEIRKQFEEVESNTIEVCFAPDCDENTIISVAKRNEKKYSQKQFTCFSCHQVGHLAVNCPQKNKTSESLVENIKEKQGLDENEITIGDKNENQSPNIAEKQAMKSCSVCGIKGRHPRGSDCPTVDKKRKQKKEEQEKTD